MITEALGPLALDRKHQIEEVAFGEVEGVHHARRKSGELPAVRVCVRLKVLQALPQQREAPEPRVLLRPVDLNALGQPE